jgi:hypothetical protein
MNADTKETARKRDYYREFNKEKGAYLKFVELIGRTMMKEIGSTQAQLFLRHSDIKAIEHLDLSFSLKRLMEKDVLKIMLTKKGGYSPSIRENEGIRVHCIMDSNQIFEYMIRLPGYELFYGVPTHNFWGEKIGAASPKGRGNKIKKGKTVAIELPKNATWDLLHLRMVEGLQNIEVLYAGKHIGVYGFEEIGFGKNNKKNPQWRLLEVFAAQKLVPKYRPTIRQLAVNLGKAKGETVEVEYLHKIKELLSSHLCQIFNIKEPPIATLGSHYELSFVIEPVQILRGNGIPEAEHLQYGEGEEQIVDETPYDQ